MTFRDMNIAVFRGEAVPHVLWQPRIDHWYSYHKRRGSLPDRYARLSEMELYDALGCAPRPYSCFNDCLRVQHPRGTAVNRRHEDTEIITVWSTPAGELTGRHRRTKDSWTPIEYPIKTVDDMTIVERVLAEQVYTFDMDAYERGCVAVGDRAAPTMFVPRINLQRLFLDLMGIEQTLFALADHPVRVRALIRAIDAADDPLLETIAGCPIEIINLGDNVDARYLGPRLFQEFLLPAYQRRSSVLRQAGKFVHAHWDGYVRPLLPYARQTGLNGIEAVTPVPQGDVTLEETRAALGDEMVLLDGIPMLSFLPDADLTRLEQQVRRAVELFSPRLILGVSDEISPVCDVERIRFVTELLAGVSATAPACPLRTVPGPSAGR